MARSRTSSGPLGLERQQPGHHVGIERVRQALRCLGCADIHAGVVREHALAQQVIAEGAQRGEAPLQAARAQAGGVAVGGEAAHVLAVERLPARHAVAIAPAAEGGEVALIGDDGVRGEAALGGEVPAEALQPFGRRRSHGC